MKKNKIGTIMFGCVLSLMTIFSSKSMAYDTAYLKEDLFITNSGDEISYDEAIDIFQNDAINYMEQMGIDEYKEKRVLVDIEDQLYLLQEETERRVLGDHGIRHVLGNWLRSEAYLDTRDDATAEQYFALLISQVYHDTGYTKDPCNLPMVHEDADQSCHDKISLEIFRADNDYNIYKSIFSEQTLLDLEYAMGTHNSSDPDLVAVNTSEFASVIVSTLNVTDKLALSTRDKLPCFLYNDPDELAIFSYCSELEEIVSENDCLIAEKLMLAKEIFENEYEYELTERYIYTINSEMSLSQQNFSGRMFYTYVPDNAYQYDEINDENVITLYEVNYSDDDPYSYFKFKCCKKIFEDLIPIRDVEDPDYYDEKIKAAYNKAKTEEGYYLEDNRGIRIFVKEINVDDIPNNKDYVTGHDYLLEGYYKAN